MGPDAPGQEFTTWTAQEPPTEDVDYYDEFDDRDDEEEDDGFECGAFINGKFDYYHCQLAGTEDCDWECPYSDHRALENRVTMIEEGPYEIIQSDARDQEPT